MNTKLFFFLCFLSALVLISAVAATEHQPSKDEAEAMAAEEEQSKAENIELDGYGGGGYYGGRGGGWGYGGRGGGWGYGGRGGGWGRGGGGWGYGGRGGGWGRGGGGYGRGGGW